MMKRNLPNFLLIGASRSGTTSLYHQLREHPDIYMPIQKEINFFSQHWLKGMEWYVNQFSDCKEEKIIGEASTTYTWPQPFDISQRVARVLPRAKLIYLIRNPIERTFSHYHYNKYRGNEKDLFLEALDNRIVYLEASNYLYWINKYLEYFESSELHVVIAEEFFENSKQELKRLYAFLGVDEFFVPRSLGIKTNASYDSNNSYLIKLAQSISRKSRKLLEKFLPEQLRSKFRNVLHHALTGGNKPVLAFEDKKYLIEKFKDDITALEEFLGRDLSIWRK